MSRFANPLALAARDLRVLIGLASLPLDHLTTREDAPKVSAKPEPVHPLAARASTPLATTFLFCA